MNNLIKFFIRFHLFFLFILLEGVCFTMIVKYNNYHRVSFLNSSNVVSGTIYKNYSLVSDYFSLKKANEQLVQENARLKNSFLRQHTDSIVSDSTLWFESNFDTAYVYIPARVINNSINRTFNYITLDKGSSSGIEQDMGVINSQGVVGIVTQVSENYSTVMSVLNSRLNISSKVKKNGYFGPLTWESKDYREASLKEIPFHVALSQGDTITTSGYTSIFPEGIMLGEISDFRVKGGSNFYQIDVKLSTDFKNITYVEVIKNQKRKERLELEETRND